jgi:PPOX class probable F420-dependent enzyme
MARNWAEMEDPDPQGSRPYMPGYGTLPADEGTGLLPWSWAVERIVRSHDLWLATTWPDGRPHVMPVWGVWLDDAVWFSSSLGSRKARNLAANDRCVLATDNPQEPVIVEGRAELVPDPPTIQRFADAVNAKYGTDYGLDFFEPEVNGCWRVRPVWAFGLAESDFTGTPTRWRFDPS